MPVMSDINPIPPLFYGGNCQIIKENETHSLQEPQISDKSVRYPSSLLMHPIYSSIALAALIVFEAEALS